MREFTLIVFAALSSAVLGGLFGAGIGYLSPEFIDMLADPRKIASPEKVGAAIGLVSGLLLGAVVMAFSLLVETIRGRSRRLTADMDDSLQAVRQS
jgi:hypothetical protein